MFLNMIVSIKERIISINGRSQTNRDSKPNLLFLQQHDQSQKFWAKLKNWQKSYKNIGIYSIGYITIKKIDDYESIDSANPLYLRVNHPNRYVKEQNGILNFWYNRWK